MDHPLPAVSMSNAGKQPYRVAVKSSTGYVAVKNSDGKIKVFPANGKSITIPSAKEIVMWPCDKTVGTSGEPESVGEIQILDCANNQLRKLDVCGLQSLQKLNCSCNSLEYLWLFGPVNSSYDGPRNLQHLDCAHNLIRELDFSELQEICTVNCSHNKIRSLRLGKKLKRLQSLNCSQNRLSLIELAGLVALQSLNAKGNSLLASREEHLPEAN